MHTEDCIVNHSRNAEKVEQVREDLPNSRAEQGLGLGTQDLLECSASISEDLVSRFWG